MAIIYIRKIRRISDIWACVGSARTRSQYGTASVAATWSKPENGARNSLRFVPITHHTGHLGPAPERG
jgi:hypothetical protein